MYSAETVAQGTGEIPGAVYLAPRGFEADLEEELERKGLDLCFRRDRLMGTRQGPMHMVGAENVWLEQKLFPIHSIADGARPLKSIQRNWALYSTVEHRRANLIQDALPRVSAKPLVFG